MPIILSLAVQLSGFSCRHTSMSPVGSHHSSFLQDATFGGGRLINCEHRTRTVHDGRSKTGRASTIWRFVVGFAKAHSATTPPVRRFASAPKQMAHPPTTAGGPRSCGLSALGIRTLSYRALTIRAARLRSQQQGSSQKSDLDATREYPSKVRC
jgi:hypothetical protein